MVGSPFDSLDSDEMDRARRAMRHQVGQVWDALQGSWAMVASTNALGPAAAATVPPLWSERDEHRQQMFMVGLLNNGRLAELTALVGGVARHSCGGDH